MLKLLPKNQKPSYEDFYSHNYSRVLRYVHGKIGNGMDAEDLTSEIFYTAIAIIRTMIRRKALLQLGFTWL